MTAELYFKWYIHFYLRDMITERQGAIVGVDVRPQRMQNTVKKKDLNLLIELFAQQKFLPVDDHVLPLVDCHEKGLNISYPPTSKGDKDRFDRICAASDRSIQIALSVADIPCSESQSEFLSKISANRRWSSLSHSAEGFAVD
jgi:hypothetical protein